MPPYSAPYRPVVFVVDDESAIADTVAEILNREGYGAISIYCAEDALDISLDKPPQMIISDVMLAGMDGIELAVKMRRIFPDCRILLFSGHGSTPGLLTSANRQGHQFDCLSKSVHPTELLARVAEGLRPRHLSSTSGD